MAHRTYDQALTAACTLLRVEIFIFCLVSFGRFVYGVHFAENGTRQEESIHTRQAACLATWTNVIISTSFIFSQLYVADVGNHKSK